MHAYAQNEPVPMPPPPSIDYAKRAALYDLARSFVKKVTKGFDAADAAMGLAPSQRQAAALMPEGDLLFNITLGLDEMPLDGVINAHVANRKLLVSLRDYFAALEFPITIDPGAGTAEGWYIRESNHFALDLKTHTVVSNKRSFTLSDQAVLQDNDIMVPPAEAANWFDFKTEAVVSNLQIKIVSPVKLPVEERLARAGRKMHTDPNGPPQYPLIAETAKDFAYPIVDVNTMATYNKDGQSGETFKSYASNIATRGDFMKGRLETQTQLNDRDKLSSVRASYVRETLQPELLGPLKARRYQLGDTPSVRMPIDDRVYQGAGMRISNIDPTRAFTNSSTGISGNAPPGWDVELYRDNQFIESQRTGSDGYYRFDKVELFRSNNNFRVVLYGPQGEIREQEVSVPVDPYRLAESGSAYDVSLSFDSMQLYRAGEEPDDQGNPRLAAIYEKPFGNDSAFDIGVTSGARGQNNEQVQALHGGLSTALGSVLMNAGVAVESTGEAGAEIVARADAGRHQFRNETNIATDHFDIASDAAAGKTFDNTFTITGPLDIPLGRSPRYNASINYGKTADYDLTDTILGYSSSFGGITLNEQMHYTTQTDADSKFVSSTSVRGHAVGLNLRGNLDYQIKPLSQIDQMTFNVQRAINDNLDLEFEHLKRPEDKYSENRIQANWRSPVATISPSLTRNSNGDTIALVNTSFSALRDGDGKIRFSNQNLGSNGTLNVLVFLDKNGDGIRQAEEEVIPDATVLAPQNGGQAVTDKDGYAHINQLRNLKQTDLYIQPDSLKDPFWIPASKGLSFLPRTGHITEVELAVNLGGQIEGNVFTQDAPTVTAPIKKHKKHKKGKKDKSVDAVQAPQHINPIPARGASIGLYNHAGEKIMSTTTEFDGYYIFSPVPPGEYFLVVDDTGQPRDQYTRPDPTPVKVGYDGTELTGQNLYLDPGADVPMRVISDMGKIEKNDAALEEKTLADKTVVLNLGQYHSRLLMSVMWFKVQKLYGKAVADLQPLVEPSNSYADVKTGEHTLRIGSDALKLKDAKERCRIIAKAGITCAVEVLPGGMQLASVTDEPAKAK